MKGDCGEFFFFFSFLLYSLYFYVRVCVGCSVMSDSLWPHGLYIASRLLCAWNSPGKNTGVGSHSPFQGIFPSQGSNADLLHCRQTLPPGKPYIFIVDIIFFIYLSLGKERNPLFFKILVCGGFIQHNLSRQLLFGGEGKPLVAQAERRRGWRIWESSSDFL